MAASRALRTSGAFVELGEGLEGLCQHLELSERAEKPDIVRRQEMDFKIEPTPKDEPGAAAVHDEPV